LVNRQCFCYHFDLNEAYWAGRTVDLALPPYWFFASRDGRELLRNRLDAIHAIGIHVPHAFSRPENVPQELRHYELCTRPGEGRRF